MLLLLYSRYVKNVSYSIFGYTEDPCSREVDDLFGVGTFYGEFQPAK